MFEFASRWKAMTATQTLSVTFGTEGTKKMTDEMSASLHGVHKR